MSAVGVSILKVVEIFNLLSRHAYDVADERYRGFQDRMIMIRLKILSKVIECEGGCQEEDRRYKMLRD